MTKEKDGLFGGEKAPQQPQQVTPKTQAQPTPANTAPEQVAPTAPPRQELRTWKDSLAVAQSHLTRQNAWDSRKIGREIGFATGIISKSTELQGCSPQTILQALLQCSRLDLTLNPVMKLTALIAYGKECKLEVQYQGLLGILKDVGAVKNMRAHLVYKDEVESGLFKYDPVENKLFHDPIFVGSEAEQNKREIYGVYSVAILPDGQKDILFMENWKVEKRRAVSKSAGSQYSPWQKWRDEMYQKTVIRRHFNFLITLSNKENERLSNLIEYLDSDTDLNQNRKANRGSLDAFDDVEVETVKEQNN